MTLNGAPFILNPLTDAEQKKLAELQTTLSPQQLSWLSGYFWALSQNSVASSTLTGGTALGESEPAKVTIIYASQTGNAKGVASDLHQKAQAEGIPTTLVDAADLKPKQLTKETHVIVVASTNGEGEAPDNALILHEFLQSKKAPKLPNLRYAVLSLGDSSYEFFCQTGKDFDQSFSKLGATAILERVDCDVDYEDTANQWIDSLVLKLKEAIQLNAAQSNSAVLSNTLYPQGQQPSQWSKNNPFTASVLTNQKITGRDSDKIVHHIELDIDGSGLTYQAGDTLGIWYQNDDALVNAILENVGLSGEEVVTVKEKTLSLQEALRNNFEITASNPNLIKQYAEISGNEFLTSLVDDAKALRDYASTHQVIDVLKLAKVPLSATQLIELLRPLTPRLYSIASSQGEVDDEVHLTVGLVAYQQDEESRFGGASQYLTQTLQEGDEVAIFIESNAQFKLPQNDDAPIIMVGPGTGIAPFRAFIQERDAKDATGKNWLFFGDRTFTQDFLYQVEWQNYVKSGRLTRLELAFSRDQKEKIYVQQRLKEQGAEVWQWLQDGAYFYVCGDASHMAKDVHDALLSIVIEHGQYSEEEANEFINELRKTKRYQKDVY